MSNQHNLDHLVNMAQQAARHSPERKEAEERLSTMARSISGLNGRDVDVLGTDWWKHPEMIMYSLDRLGHRLRVTELPQVARAWNELVSAVGQVGHDQGSALELFLDQIDPGSTHGTKLLVDLLDSSNQMIGPLDTFYGDHLRVAWPAIDRWLASQGRVDDKRLVAHAALRPAISMSMQHGPQDPLNGVLECLPHGDLFGGFPLVFQWLYAINTREQQMGLVQTLDRLIEHGADLQATWNGQTILGAASKYLRSAEDGLLDDRNGALGLLIERGARWEDQAQAMGPDAWGTIQDHPKVVAHRLNEVAFATRNTFAPTPKSRL